MKILFVPYTIALALKELGFNELCLAFFTGNNEQIQIDEDFATTNSSLKRIHEIRSKAGESERLMISAPLYQQAIDWLYKEYKIGIMYSPIKKSLDIDILMAIETIKNKK